MKKLNVIILSIVLAIGQLSYTSQFASLFNTMQNSSQAITVDSLTRESYISPDMQWAVLSLNNPQNMEINATNGAVQNIPNVDEMLITIASKLSPTMNYSKTNPFNDAQKDPLLKALYAMLEATEIALTFIAIKSGYQEAQFINRQDLIQDLQAQKAGIQTIINKINTINQSYSSWIFGASGPSKTVKLANLNLQPIPFNPQTSTIIIPANFIPSIIQLQDYKQQINATTAANLLFKQCFIAHQQHQINPIPLNKIKQLNAESYVYQGLLDIYKNETYPICEDILKLNKDLRRARLLEIRQAVQTALFVANKKSSFNIGSQYVTSFFDGIVSELMKYDAHLAILCKNPAYGATNADIAQSAQWSTMSKVLAVGGVLAVAAASAAVYHYGADESLKTIQNQATSAKNQMAGAWDSASGMMNNAKGWWSEKPTTAPIASTEIPVIAAQPAQQDESVDNTDATSDFNEEFKDIFETTAAPQEQASQDYGNQLDNQPLQEESTDDIQPALDFKIAQQAAENARIEADRIAEQTRLEQEAAEQAKTKQSKTNASDNTNKLRDILNSVPVNSQPVTPVTTIPVQQSAPQEESAPATTQPTAKAIEQSTIAQIENGKPVDNIKAPTQAAQNIENPTFTPSTEPIKEKSWKEKFSETLGFGNNEKKSTEPKKQPAAPVALPLTKELEQFKSQNPNISIDTAAQSAKIDAEKLAEQNKILNAQKNTAITTANSKKTIASTATRELTKLELEAATLDRKIQVAESEAIAADIKAGRVKTTGGWFSSGSPKTAEDLILDNLKKDKENLVTKITTTQKTVTEIQQDAAQATQKAQEITDAARETEIKSRTQHAEAKKLETLALIEKKNREIAAQEKIKEANQRVRNLSMQAAQQEKASNAQRAQLEKEEKAENIKRLQEDQLAKTQQKEEDKLARERMLKEEKEYEAQLKALTEEPKKQPEKQGFFSNLFGNNQQTKQEDQKRLAEEQARQNKLAQQADLIDQAKADAWVKSSIADKTPEQITAQQARDARLTQKNNKPAQVTPAKQTTPAQKTAPVKTAPTPVASPAKKATPTPQTVAPAQPTQASTSNTALARKKYNSERTEEEQAAIDAEDAQNRENPNFANFLGYGASAPIQSTIQVQPVPASDWHLEDYIAGLN